MASFDDVDIFGPPAPLPDIGYGLEPMEPTPAMQRRDTVAKYLQKIGYEPRRAYQMAEKMVGTGELVGEFLPGTSKALAEERDDVWGERLSYLDLLGPAGAAVAIPVKAAKKGIKSLSDAPRLKRAKKMGFDVDNPVYHGTHTKNIDEFKEGHIGARDEGFFGRGHYFADTQGEASRYGPNIGKYFIKGKALDLNTNLDVVKTSTYDRFKEWAKQLDEIGALSKNQKKALTDLKKAEGYYKDKVVIDTIKNYDGTTAYRATIESPIKYKGDKQAEKISSSDIYAFTRNDKNPLGYYPTKENAIRETKSMFLWKMSEGSNPRYPDLGNMYPQLKDYILYEGGPDFVSKQASKAGYDMIKVADETVVFNPKNIRSVDAKFDPTKAESAKIAAGITGVAGAGVIGSTLDEPLEGNTREIL